MAHLAPADDETVAEFGPVFQRVKDRMGFVPNSLLTMARDPELLRAFMGLAEAVLGPHRALDPELAQLVAHVASAAAGCRYCQAHTGHVAERLGTAAAKVEAVWAFESSDRFTEAERAALALAQAAAEVPNRAGAAEFAEARRWFGEDEVMEIVAVVAFFGFLNRWNDTLATELEDAPRAFGEAHLADRGWEVGKHEG